MFHSLDDCINDDSIFLCEPQSAIHKVPDDCVTKALRLGKIDENVCELRFVELKKILIVTISSEKFFYFTPKNDFINVTCGEIEKIENITDSGIIYLPSGCSARHQNFKLTPTHMNLKEFKVKNVLTTVYNEEEILKRASGEISALEQNIFYDNMEKLRNVVKPKEDLEDLEKIVFASRFDWWLILIVVLAIIAALVAAKFFKCMTCMS